MRWVEAGPTRRNESDVVAAALEEVRFAVDALNADELRVEFHQAKRDRASLSQAIVKALSRRLIASGWQEKAHHDVRRLPASHDLWIGETALRFGFQHESAVLRNILAPTIESITARAGEGSCRTWSAAVVVAATEDFRKVAGMNGAVGTFEDYQVCMRACESLLATPVTVIGLTGTDDIRVVHERDYKGRKRGYVETEGD